MNFIERLNQRIQAHAYSGPQEAYSQELSRCARERDKFVRSPEAEAMILQRWELAGLYAKNVLEARWPAFEEEMALSQPTDNPNGPLAVYRYVASMIGKPVPEFEKHIVLSSHPAADYAINVKKAPWIEEGVPADPISLQAHNKIKESSGAQIAYHYHFNRDQYGPQEPKM